MRKKDNPLIEINNRLDNLEIDIMLIKQQLKSQSKLIWFILGLIATIFVRVILI
jgi:hypothetical protein